MDRIYEVKIGHPFDHNVYFVRAASVSTAADLALQADAKSAAGQALKNDRTAHNTPRVSSVKEFCATDQLVS